MSVCSLTIPASGCQMSCPYKLMHGETGLTPLSGGLTGRGWGGHQLNCKLHEVRRRHENRHQLTWEREELVVQGHSWSSGERPLAVVNQSNGCQRVKCGECNRAKKASGFKSILNLLIRLLVVIFFTDLPSFSSDLMLRSIYLWRLDANSRLKTL